MRSSWRDTLNNTIKGTRRNRMDRMAGFFIIATIIGGFFFPSLWILTLGIAVAYAILN